MCVAVATGLFDSAINYAWNASITELRQKVRRFGLAVVRQVTGKAFSESDLLDLKDVELLRLCLQLNLISEEGFFLLDQCRDIRNNFSAAHPAMAALDEDEFLAFLNRCAKYALANDRNLRGVDIQAFLAALHGVRFSEPQKTMWQGRLAETFDAQRDALFGTMHGIYCDPTTAESGRLNALDVCGGFAANFSDRTKSELVDRHQDYIAKGDEPRHKASQLFFQRLGLLGLLGASEFHAFVTSASRSLFAVHNEYNNFHNEPPFAQRLAEIVAQNRVPESAQPMFVETVVTTATGNQWGVSNAAMFYYQQMISGFSPNEIKLMLDLPRTNTTVGNRIRVHARCRSGYAALVRLLDPASIPAVSQALYAEWRVVP